MANFSLRPAITLLPVLCAAAALLTLRPAQAADLSVQVDGNTTSRGTVMVGLFDKNAPFPKTPLQGQRVAAGSAPVVVVFKNLAPGRYAISAYHDENDNHSLDRGMFGIPKERYGFSQDARGAGGPPEFRDAAFELGDADQRVTLTLR